jgi:hypothetical protein
MDRRIVLFLFVGREANLRVQIPYWQRMLSDWPGLEIELWNMSRNRADDAYVRRLESMHERVRVRNELYEVNDWPEGLCRRRLRRPRWCGCRECKPGQFERPYAIYAEDPDYADAYFVKADDDIVFWETDRLGDLFAVLDVYPRAVVSALVTNNVVSAKHDPELRALVEASAPVETQRDWFDLHTSAGFARLSHDHFLDRMQRQGGVGLDVMRGYAGPAQHERALPGERPSINTIAFTHATMRRLATVMASPMFRKMGDEGAVCQNFLPRICTTFRTAHLYFGPQRVGMGDDELDAYRERYVTLSKAYLG